MQVGRTPWSAHQAAICKSSLPKSHIAARSVAVSFRLARDRKFTLTTQRTNAFPDLDRDLRFIPLGVDEPRVLTYGQIRRYNKAGHLFPVDIFSPTEIAEIRAYIDDLLPRALAAGWDKYQVVNWHKHCRGIWDIVTDSRIIAVVSDLLGDTVILRHSHLFAKLPGDPKRVSWHQDASYWPLTPSRVVSAWPAIDDVDVDNSAMQVIGGSHHHAQLTFRDSTATENNVLSQTVDSAADYGDAPVALEMRAGQISLHSDWILHGSEPNGSNRRRCGLADGQIRA